MSEEKTSRQRKWVFLYGRTVECINRAIQYEAIERAIRRHTKPKDEEHSIRNEIQEDFLTYEYEKMKQNTIQLRKGK